jgi:hypothetical protein
MKVDDFDSVLNGVMPKARAEGSHAPNSDLPAEIAKKTAAAEKLSSPLNRPIPAKPLIQRQK